jgi:radical SAM family RiPP maturation amino acid epimerase
MQTEQTSAVETRAAEIPLAEFKRLCERVLGDTEFIRLLRDDPMEAARQCGFNWDPTEIRSGWDGEWRKAHPDEPDHPSLAAYKAYVREKLEFRDQARANVFPANPTYRQWRERQKARLRLDVGEVRAHGIIHAPMSFELNKGCSVGCWFCGIGAPKLSDTWFYTEENASLWRDTLSLIKEVVGEAARWGFCYWATDPLDNPDYEKFLVDYHTIFGIFPQTTTALALKDPERTRHLLRVSEAHGCTINRFSILSLKKLLQVHETFTPEELRHVECIPQNAESLYTMAKAGRAAEKAEKKNTRGKRLVGEIGGTIACVSGFLFSMVDRTIKLVTPCSATEEWPLGYWVVDEGSFTDADDLRVVLERMMARMPTSVRQLPKVRWARQFMVRLQPDGVILDGPVMRVTMREPARAEWLRDLGRLLAEGTNNAEEIALLCMYRHGVAEETTLEQLEQMFSKGMLDEDPKPAVPGSWVEDGPSPTAVFLSLFDEAPPAVPATPPEPSPAETFLSLFEAPLTPSKAALDYHGQFMTAHDRMLWLSRLQAPRGRTWADTLAALGKKPRGVLHVGAHYGLELESYIASGFGRIAFFEASPLVLGFLREHVGFWNRWLDVLGATWGLARRPTIEVVECAVADREGTMEMHVMELEMLSSLLRPSQDWMREQRRVPVRTARLDLLMEENGLDARDFNVLTVDVQGAEDRVFDGAEETLKGIEVIHIELNYTARYEGAVSAEAIDRRLRAMGFECKGQAVTDPHGAIGDAIYVR